jgi:hypothetical protein
MFSSLRKNWDSYRSKPISRYAIQRALGVASHLDYIIKHRDLPMTQVPFAAPMSSGGILFEIRDGERELQIEIEPESSGRYQVYRLSGELADREQEEGAAVSESGLTEALSWVFRI